MSTEYPAEIENERMRCPSCGVGLPSESTYCNKCGARTVAQVHRCASCGAELSSQSAYCSKCGARNERRVRYSLWRVGILTFISFGFYYIYWMYVSWKHLAAEMPGKEFHPVWHALTQFVPIYNFVVLYQHFRTIKEVQQRERVESSLVPGLAVVLSVVAAFFVAITYQLPDRAVVLWGMLSFIAIIGEGILVIWGQRNLNKYWERPGAPSVRSAGTGPGEVIITAVGGMFTGLVLIGVIFQILTISSLNEADSRSPIDVGSEYQGTIEGYFFDVDTYRFTVRGGTKYAIVVDPAGLGGDPLESAIVTLWDSDGTTALSEVNASTPIVIPWTASSSGARFVTIESDGVGLGDYVLQVVAR